MPRPASEPTFAPVRSAAELRSLMEILGPTFNMNDDLRARYAKVAGRSSFRACRQGRELLGGCALLRFGQFYGGHSIPTVGVSVVGVAPEHRGKRVATIMMREAIREMHKTGWPLAALYPATLPVYRACGYEIAGLRHEIRIPAKTLNLRAGESLEIRRITAKDEPAMRGLYRAKAVRIPGHIDRNDFVWQRVKAPRGQVAEGFLFINPATDKPEGYAWLLRRDAGDFRFSIHLTDQAVLTPAAGRTLLALVANYRSIIEEISFEGSPADPLVSLLPERVFSSKLIFPWMLRIVDVPFALAARGYPAGFSGEIHLDVEDDLITANNGRFVLAVNHGKPGVQSGGRGDLKIDIRGLAPLYSGHLSPHQLLITGQMSIQGKAKQAERSLEAAATAFAGPAPWMPDMF